MSSNDTKVAKSFVKFLLLVSNLIGRTDTLAQADIDKERGHKHTDGRVISDACSFRF
jgi:hypothetical protein